MTPEQQKRIIRKIREQTRRTPWTIHELLLDDDVRLSRLIAIPAGMLAVLAFVFGLIGGNLLVLGVSELAGSLSAGVWMLGDGWQRREDRRKFGTNATDHSRGFDVVDRSTRVRDDQPRDEDAE